MEYRSSYLESSARNSGLEEQHSYEQRYANADEFLEVTYKLWEGSCRDDAVVKGDMRQQYVYPDKVRRIDHERYALSIMRTDDET